MKRIWWKESVVYQIYPRSFNDSNGDGIGDLNGITEKLDYLKELGVDVIWLSPIYKSPNDDNGYDISDYRNIMDEFGTMQDFECLLDEAHKRGLKIMLDLVVNHTSDEHEWFAQSKTNMDSKYKDFYIWKKGKNGDRPNNWGSYFGGSAWEYSSERDMYYLHLFSKKQPDLNWENKELREEVYDMMKWWLNKGVDGFRMDVINMISKVQEMPDGIVAPGSPYGDHSPYVLNGPRVHEFLKEMNQKVLSQYDTITVGEAPGAMVEDGIKYTSFDEKELNMVFTFEHMDVDNDGDSKWSDKRFELVKLKEILTKWQVGLNGRGWNSLYWNNHDQPRVVSRFGNDAEYWNISAKMLGTCLHMMQGTPYIYQGEEIGMTNIAFNTIEEYEDIESINAFKQHTEILGVDKEKMMSCIRWRSRDNARTPMQWDDSENAGFTSGKPWFTVNPNYKMINATSQISDPDSIFQYYKKLIRLRKEYDIIVYGDYQLLSPDSETIFSYIRALDEQRLLVVCNFSDKENVFEMPTEFANKIGKKIISNYADREYITVEKEMQLRPYEVNVLLYE